MVDLSSLSKEEKLEYWKWHGIIDSKPENYFGEKSDCSLIPKYLIDYLKEDFEGIREYIKYLESQIKFTTISLGELDNYEPPKYTWRVQNLIQDKKIMIVAGASAVCKSWLMLNLSLDVARGEPFLENFETQQGGVLFIDRENSIPELKNRVEMIAKGIGLNEKELPLYFLSEQSLRLDDYETLDYLKRYIEHNKIKLIVVDTYRRVIGFEENDANRVSFFFTDCLKPICEETGCSFVFIHHHKKGRSEVDEKEMLRGSSDLVNFVDGILQINRKGSNISVKQTKNRSGKEIEPFDLRIDTDEEEYFKFEYLGEKQDTSVLGRVVERLLIWLSEEEINSFETKEARDYCFNHGFKKQKFFEGLEELQKIGVVEKIGRGKYKVVEKAKTSELVHSPLYKSGGLVDYKSPSKSMKSMKSIWTKETSETKEEEDLEKLKEEVAGKLISKNELEDSGLDEESIKEYERAGLTK